MLQVSDFRTVVNLQDFDMNYNKPCDEEILLFN